MKYHLFFRCLMVFISNLLKVERAVCSIQIVLLILTQSMSPVPLLPLVAVPLYLYPPSHPEQPHDQGGLAAAAPAADGHLLPGRNAQAQTTWVGSHSGQGGGGIFLGLWKCSN